MLTFLKSDLFLRFLGGFAVGSVGLFAVHLTEPPALTTPAMAAPESLSQANSKNAVL